MRKHFFLLFSLKYRGWWNCEEFGFISKTRTKHSLMWFWLIYLFANGKLLLLHVASFNSNRTSAWELLCQTDIWWVSYKNVVQKRLSKTSSIKLCVNSFHEFNFPLFLTLVCLPSFAGFDLVVKNFDNVCFWVLHVKIKLGYCRIFVINSLLKDYT